jgi:putative oxidoreductase
MQNTNLGLLIIRSAIGILMLLHGLYKVFNGVEGIENMLHDKGMPGFMAYGVYLGEVAAPLFLIVGYRARLAALVLFINMSVIFFIAHPDQIFSLTEHWTWKLEIAGLYFFGSLGLFFTGAGRYALSHKNKWD